MTHESIVTLDIMNVILIYLGKYHEKKTKAWKRWKKYWEWDTKVLFGKNKISIHSNINITDEHCLDQQGNLPVPSDCAFELYF